LVQGWVGQLVFSGGFAIECRLLESLLVVLLWSVDMKGDISSAISGIGFAVFGFRFSGFIVHRWPFGEWISVVFVDMGFSLCSWREEIFNN